MSLSSREELARELARLRDDCDEAIDSALSVAAITSGAINWANLHCCSAQKVLELDGDGIGEFYRVEIEEASPDAGELSEYVTKALAAKGWTNVEVATEW